MSKFSTEGLAIEIAGSKYAVETSQDVIKGWSPNNIRGIILGLDERGIFVNVFQYIGKQSRKVYVPNEHRSRTVSALNLIFQRRKYSCLEFFCWFNEVLALGLDPSKTLQYLKGSPLLQVVGGIRSELDFNKNLLGQLIQAGASELEGIVGVDGVYFQPATYELDTKIKEKFDEVKNTISLVKKIDNDLSKEGLFRIKLFKEFLAFLQSQSLDFYSEICKSFESTLSTHEMGLEREELSKLIENYSPSSVDDFNEFIGILNVLDSCFKNSSVKSSGTVLRLEEFCKGWYSSLRDEIKGTIGNSLVEMFCERYILSDEPLEKIKVLLNIESILGGQGYE